MMRSPYSTTARIISHSIKEAAQGHNRTCPLANAAVTAEQGSA